MALPPGRFSLEGAAMAVTVNVRSELAAFARTLNALGRGQLRFAAAMAMNASARAARDALRQQMKTSFDKPTPWTLNSTYIKPARTKEPQLSAEVFFKDWSPKGIAAGKYLQPHIDGGPRRQKSSERKLSVSLNRGGLFLVPTKYAERNAYGNLNPGQVITVLTRLAAGTMGLPSSNSGKGKRKRENYIAIVPGRPQGKGGRGGGLPPGIYKVTGERKSRALLPIFSFAKSPPKYSKRLDFWGVTTQTFKREFPGELRKAMAKAMKNARAKAKIGGRWH